MKTLAPLAEKGKINPEASIRDSQSTIILAPIDRVWEVLSNVSNWPEWNDAVTSVSFKSLEVGASFKWDVSGTTISATLRMIQEPEVLSWTATSMGLKLIHVWRLEKTDEDRTIVTAEESMEGFRTLFYGHQKLHNTLLKWLESLKQRAEAK